MDAVEASIVGSRKHVRFGGVLINRRSGGHPKMCEPKQNAEREIPELPATCRKEIREKCIPDKGIRTDSFGSSFWSGKC
jgi:hypothetical protein